MRPYDIVLNLVARQNHRVLIGLPLCRDPDYLANVAEHAKQVGMATQALKFFPEVIRPYYLTAFSTKIDWHRDFSNFAARKTPVMPVNSFAP